MTRGVVIFAHSTAATDYYALASATAKRVERFLHLPTTLVTDRETLGAVREPYAFHNVITLDRDGTNYRSKNVEWHNRGRYRVYDLTPYDETLVLDSDYIINSPTLLSTFDYSSDFVCHDKCRYLLNSTPPEYFRGNAQEILWATVLRYRKTRRTEAIFKMIEMIQNNYYHYSQVYKFMPHSYRNDYALTIALSTVNAHVPQRQDYLRWPLLHVGTTVRVEPSSATSAVLRHHYLNDSRPAIQYIHVRDTDFHMLDKDQALMVNTYEN